jgi:hypothetical protein
MTKLMQIKGMGNPEGFLLRYGTSLEAPEPEPGRGGLGFTNVNTLHHWVGYVAVGYW